MGNLGFQELMLIFIIALIVFGPKKLPELGKTIGKGLAEFRRASNELRNTWEEEVRLEELKKYEKMADPYEDLNKPAGTPTGGNYALASPGNSHAATSDSGPTTPAATAEPVPTDPSKPTPNEPGKA